MTAKQMLEFIVRVSTEYHPEYRTTQTEVEFYKAQLKGIIESVQFHLKVKEV